MWQIIIAVDDIDLTYFGSVDNKRTRHVSDVAKVFQAFGGRVIGDVAWSLHGASGCAMLGACDFDGAISAYRPVGNAVLEHTSALEASNVVGAWSVRAIPPRVLLQLVGDGTRSVLGAN